jgi:hypothetical protein
MRAFYNYDLLRRAHYAMRQSYTEPSNRNASIL